MTDKDFVLTTMRKYGMRRAQDLQETSEGMTGTELYEKEDYIPDFSAAIAKKNMLERKAGKTDGFLCRSSAGRIVRLIQNYNSDIIFNRLERKSNPPPKTRSRKTSIPKNPFIRIIIVTSIC